MRPPGSGASVGGGEKVGRGRGKQGGRGRARSYLPRAFKAAVTSSGQTVVASA
jgi:hypothetical protein